MADAPPHHVTLAAGPRRRWLPRWRPHNVVRLLRMARASFRPAEAPPTAVQLLRLHRAERRGLQLAILCRTILLDVALVWWVVSLLVSGSYPTLLGISIPLALTALGAVHFVILGTRFDRAWVKFAAVAIDMAAMAAMFATVNVASSANLPQIYAFRMFDALLLVPFVALTTLAMSPRLVLWAGVTAAAFWLASFAFIVSGMERTVSWSDLPDRPTRAEWEAIVMSPDFIGAGTVYSNAIALVAIAAVLALAVYRARHVFLKEVEAEAQRERERLAREAITQQLGRFVPTTVAARLIEDPTALQPQVRHGAALVMDITGFTAFAEGRDPGAVISELNTFLAVCADEVAACGGVVITFMGDGILATFNTPIEQAEPERAALAAARALLVCGARHGFVVRVGAAAGPIAAGSVGSTERQAFTVYGDTVNRAARLETLAKRLGRQILADAACASCDDRCEPCGAHELDGFSAAVEVWSPPCGTVPLHEPRRRPSMPSSRGEPR